MRFTHLKTKALLRVLPLAASREKKLFQVTEKADNKGPAHAAAFLTNEKRALFSDAQEVLLE